MCSRGDMTYKMYNKNIDNIECLSTIHLTLLNIAGQ